jgi:hypothetical protein
MKRPRLLAPLRISPPLRLLPPRGGGPRLLAIACAAVVLAGCGSQVAGKAAGQAGASSPGTGSTTAPAAGPRQRADADAARIIADFPRPAGAVRTGLIASLTSAGMGIGSGDVVTATRWWRVPGQPRATLAWIRAHLPAGFTPAGSGSGSYGNSSSVEMQADAFALPPVPGVLDQRQLVVTAVPYRGETALRTDAQVAWLPARPAAERIPSGVRAVTVTPVFGLNRNAGLDRLDHAFTVTDPAKVARIVALANSLTVYPPGVHPCPADFGGAMRLAFLTRPGGQVLARFSAEYAGCGIVSVSVGGRTMPALSDSTGSDRLFQDRVVAIAGVRWPHQPGAPAGMGTDPVAVMP